MDTFDLGRHEAQIERLLAGQEALQQSVGELRTSVSELHGMVQQAKGAKSALVAATALGSMVVGLCGWLFEHVFLHRSLGKP
jgi:signal transduction histidine kinase